MRLTLRLDSVTLFGLTLFEPVGDEDEVSEAIADPMPFGFVASEPEPEPDDDDE